MLLVLAESAEEMHVDGASLVGFDADGKRLETAVDMSVSPAMLAGAPTFFYGLKVLSVKFGYVLCGFAFRGTV